MRWCTYYVLLVSLSTRGRPVYTSATKSLFLGLDQTPSPRQQRPCIGSGLRRDTTLVVDEQQKWHLLFLVMDLIIYIVYHLLCCTFKIYLTRILHSHSTIVLPISHLSPTIYATMLVLILYESVGV